MLAAVRDLVDNGEIVFDIVMGTVLVVDVVDAAVDAEKRAGTAVFSVEQMSNWEELWSRSSAMMVMMWERDSMPIGFAVYNWDLGFGSPWL